MIPRPIAPLLAAFTFLTRLPLPGAAGVDAATLARSTVWFPLVGAVVGGVGALALEGAVRIWPPVVAAALSLLATVLLTGAFHEDALADAADGLGGGRDREHALEIMRDSRIGSYGAVALVLVLSARIGCLAALATSDRAIALVGAHALGRWSSLPLLGLLPYARPQGAGAPFAGTTGARVIVGTLLAAIFVALTLGPHAPAAGLVAIAITTLAAGYFRARLGGITGDCLGATNQVVELATYLVVLA
jgi:adenosylcobinamide-GDP ribazoletransferase